MNSNLGKIEEGNENENEENEENEDKEPQQKKSLIQDDPDRPTVFLDDEEDKNAMRTSDNRFTDVDRVGKFGYSEPEPDPTQNPELGNKNNEVITKKKTVVRNAETFNYHLVVIGDFGSGKTSLINKFVYNEMNYTNNENNDSMEKVKSKSINIDQSTIINLSIFDTDGSEQYSPLPKTFYKDIYAAIIVFDLTNKESFDRIEYWLMEVNKAAPRDCVVMIIGNKSDIPDRKVDLPQIVSISQKNNLEFAEVSAKTGNNVALAFDKLANKIHSKQLEEAHNPDKVDRERISFRINRNEDQDKGSGKHKKKKCC